MKAQAKGDKESVQNFKTDVAPLVRGRYSYLRYRRRQCSEQSMRAQAAQQKRYHGMTFKHDVPRTCDYCCIVKVARPSSLAQDFIYEH